MEAKAWIVSDRLGEHSVVVYASSRNEARSDGASSLEIDYIEARVRRAPEWDDKVPGVADLLAAGWFYYCGWCERPLRQENGPLVVSGEVFCGASCQRKAENWEAAVAGANAGRRWANAERIYDAHEGRPGWHMNAHPSLVPGRYAEPAQ